MPKQEDRVSHFKCCVQAYGRSTLNSAIPHPAKEAQTLENQIVTAGKKLVGLYVTVIKELDSFKEKYKKLEVSLSTLKKENATIMKQMKAEKAIAERAKAAQLKAEEALKVEKKKVKELEVAVRQTKKMERSEMAGIWENAEKVKLDQ